MNLKSYISFSHHIITNLMVVLLAEEIRTIKQGLRDAVTQTNSNLLLDDVQRKIDNALTRTNSLVSRQ